MGVYIFNLNVLKESLIEDHHDNNSGHDFGKNVIPKLLKTGKRLWAYTFSGYWRDVGTIQSYYESNMDLVTRVPEFNLFDPNWRIYTPNPVKPAHYIGPKGYVIRSIVAEGCMIYGTVINSVIFPGVTIEENACVENCIIMSNSTVKQGSYLNCTIIGEKTVIGTGVKTGIGEYAENIFNSKIYNSKITVIGSDAVIPDNVTIGCNVVIDNQIMPGDFPFTYIPSGYALLKGDGGHV